MRLTIVGPGRCGKDTAAEHLAATTSLRFTYTTSWVIAPHAAKILGLTTEEAFAQRHEDRAIWRRIGDELREHDHAYLARRTLDDGDLCIGVRSLKEIRAVRAEGLTDLIIWVERDVPHDDTLEFGSEEADVVIENNGTIPELYSRLGRFARTLKGVSVYA